MKPIINQIKIAPFITTNQFLNIFYSNNPIGTILIPIIYINKLVRLIRRKPVFIKHGD